MSGFMYKFHFSSSVMSDVNIQFKPSQIKTVSKEIFHHGCV
jgi:hypothetical protein